MGIIGANISRNTVYPRQTLVSFIFVCVMREGVASNPSREKPLIGCRYICKRSRARVLARGLPARKLRETFGEIPRCSGSAAHSLRSRPINVRARAADAKGGGRNDASNGSFFQTKGGCSPSEISTDKIFACQEIESAPARIPWLECPGRVKTA